MYKSYNVSERIKEIAKIRNISIKQLLIDVGLGFNTMSNMKTSMPKADNLAKIADYLNCSVDYLLGRTDNPSAVATTTKNTLTITDERITEEEYEIIKKYRSQPEYQESVKRILGINKPSPYAAIAAYGDGEVQAPKKKRIITD